MKNILIIVALGVVAYMQFYQTAVVVETSIQDELGFSYSDNLTINQPPIQKSLRSNTSSKFDEYELIPQAEFQLQARVLGSKRYTSDRESDLSPIDLALGWGLMSKNTVLDEIDISQSNRFFFWKVTSFPVPRSVIETSSANMHLIPANIETREMISQAQPGDKIQLKGFLVNIKSEDGWRWNSSLTRDDTGAGACEVILVDNFKIL